MLDPFQISTLAELRLFMETNPFPSQANYKLTATIAAADTSTWLAGLGWQPVDGTLLDSFDGNGFEIQGLVVNRPLEDAVGFFKQTSSICCQDLKNISIVGGQITGHDKVGGLIGSSSLYATITNSRSTAAITGNASVGGLVGEQGSGSIQGSSSAGTVTASADFSGGLVGANLGGSIASSHATGTVSGRRQAGGLVGVYVQGSAASLTTSWAEGNVTGDDRVGGLIGDSSGKVTFSHATGTATGSDVNPFNAGFASVGGLIGYQAPGYAIEDSYASGAVSGKLKGIGGLVGANFGSILRGSTIAGQTVTGITAGSGFAGGLVGINSGQIDSSSAAGTVTVAGTAGAVGGLVGLQSSSFNILSSSATGNVTATSANQVGGLVGWQSTGQIIGSHADGAVSGVQDVGGLVGRSEQPAVKSSYATGSVSGQSLVGGLIGSKGNGQVDLSHATGTVTGTADNVGGLIGLNSGPVTKSYAKTGTVTGQQWVGGLVGYNQGSIASSYAANDVTGTKYVGGLVGLSTDPVSFGIMDCFAKGQVTGNDAVGGLVGRNDSLSNIARCYASGTLTVTGSVPTPAVGGLVGDNQRPNNFDNYWNADTTAYPGIGSGSAVGATGLTSAQMLHQVNFAGFVFPSPWLIDEGITQPYLDWMLVAVSPALVSAASRKHHGAAGDFDLPLALTPANPTTEPRQGPAATVVLTFDKAVNGGVASVTEGTAVAGTPTFSGNDVIVILTGVTNAQYVTVALTNVASADGGTGGFGSVRIGFLAGDVTGNRVVTLADVLGVNGVLAQGVSASNFQRDVNLSGTLTLADKLLVNSNLTHSLPTP